MHSTDAMYGRTDTELVRTYAATQDERAFRELVVRHRHMIYRACLRILQAPREAQDATQAAFLVLVRRASKLRREGSLTGWFYDVAREVSLEVVRRRKAQTGRQKTTSVPDDPANRAIAPSESADPRFVLAILDSELARLSSVLRHAVVLRHLEGRNLREAAVLAGCPLETMESRAGRGISHLRSRLARRGIALSPSSLVAVLEAEAHAEVPDLLFYSILMAAKNVVATDAAAALASPSATSLAERVMRVMFWTKVKVSVAAACAAVALVGVPAAVTISMAAEPSAGKAGGTVQAADKAAAAEKTGTAKVQVKVGNENITLSVMKDGKDYFVVCPPCAGHTSCEKLDRDKAASKTSLRKGDTGFYACCAYCLGEIKKDSAKYTKLFDAELKKTSVKGSAKKL